MLTDIFSLQVDTRLSVTTETVGIESSAVVGARAAGHSMVMVVEEGAAGTAANAATRTTGKVGRVDTSGTTTVRVATISTRMVTTTRRVRAVAIADEGVWTDHPDLTVVEWIEEVCHHQYLLRFQKIFVIKLSQYLIFPGPRGGPRGNPRGRGGYRGGQAGGQGVPAGGPGPKQ